MHKQIISDSADSYMIFYLEYAMRNYASNTIQDHFINIIDMLCHKCMVTYNETINSHIWYFMTTQNTDSQRSKRIDSNIISEITVNPLPPESHKVQTVVGNKILPSVYFINSQLISMSSEQIEVQSDLSIATTKNTIIMVL